VHVQMDVLQLAVAGVAGREAGREEDEEQRGYRRHGALFVNVSVGSPCCFCRDVPLANNAPTVRKLQMELSFCTCDSSSVIHLT
jgi:hypothetical protein